MKDWTEQRFGRLVVIRYAGTVRYGGREQSCWQCRCDCGELLTLAVDQLPTTVRSRQTMMRSGRRLYDSCETCRQKTCPICGGQFSHSHPSYLCPSPACQLTAQREREAFWHAVHLHRRREDTDYRSADNARKREWYQRNAGDIGRRRSEHYHGLPEAERLRLRARNRDYYQAMKADPERYANWLAWHRQYRGEQALKSMLADANRLQQLFEQEDE